MNTISRIACLIMLVSGIPAELARSDLILSIDNHQLLPDTPNQEIIVWGTFVSSPDSTVSMIGGLQLNVRIGDGTGTIDVAPVFQGARESATTSGLSFVNTIWDGSSTDSLGEAPIPGFPQYASVGIGFVSNANSRSLTSVPQAVGRLFIDTRGVTGGSYALTLDDGNLGASYFLSSSDVPLADSTFVRNGSFTVAVPEPLSLLLFGWLGLPLFHRRRHRT